MVLAVLGAVLFLLVFRPMLCIDPTGVVYIRNPIGSRRFRSEAVRAVSIDRWGLVISLIGDRVARSIVFQATQSVGEPRWFDVAEALTGTRPESPAAQLRWPTARRDGHPPVMLTPSQARAVLADLLHATTGSIGAREAGWARLVGMAAADLVRLEDNARTGRPWDDPPWSLLGDDPQIVLETVGLIAAVASLHPDGRVRQAATRALVRHPGPLPAALVALRCVDHVEHVRVEALAALGRHAEVEEARGALPVLLAVAGRGHGPAALASYTQALVTRHGGPRVFVQLLDVGDWRVRRWALAACLDAELLTPAELLTAAQDRHDQVIRRVAAEHLGRREDIHPAVLRTLLTGRYADGRVAALAALPDADLTDAELRAALLDRSTRVRDTARWRAHRRGLEATAIYREALDENAGTSPRVVAAALEALKWAGDRSDLPAITSRLADAHPSVRTAAVGALVARTTDSAAVAHHAAALLLDVSPRVARAAARALAAAAPASTRDVEEAAWASPQSWSRRAAWRLGRDRGGWERVAADLRAAADPALAELGRVSLLNWLRTAAATTWHQPQGAQAARLVVLLSAARLDADTVRLVTFHAGLQQPPDRPPPSTPAEDVPVPEAGRWSWRRRRRKPR